MKTDIESKNIKTKMVKAKKSMPKKSEAKRKRFVILHSNDMHGDFLAEIQGQEGDLIGGLALLSGYINKVRREEENVLYVISGDMLQGSLIDSEYKGISTMEIMNYLAPDVVALGNHEFDYGLPHLLFLEKITNFPVVNANLYVKKYNKRLMKPYIIIKKAGFDILFTGIITENAIREIEQDRLISSFVTIHDAAEEVGRITDAYKSEDIDLTILLTHIGFESDKELAALLKPEWGVDLIIGGHSHTVLEQPEKVNNILIAQAGVGTNQIGRFDIIVDDKTNKIEEYKWQLIPITDDLAEPDQNILDFIQSFKEKVDSKYNTILCNFAKQLTHPKRCSETSLGNLFADVLTEFANCDVMLLGSGSIRSDKLGPIVTLRDFRETLPYDDSLVKFTVTGSLLKRIFTYIMRPDNLGGEGECYQVNHGVKAVYDDVKGNLKSLTINGNPVEDSQLYSLASQSYHIKYSQANLGVTLEELQKAGKSSIISVSLQAALEEHLNHHQNIDSKVEGRLIYKSSEEK